MHGKGRQRGFSSGLCQRFRCWWHRVEVLVARVAKEPRREQRCLGPNHLMWFSRVGCSIKDSPDYGARRRDESELIGFVPDRSKHRTNSNPLWRGLSRGPGKCFGRIVEISSRSFMLYLSRMKRILQYSLRGNSYQNGCKKVGLGIYLLSILPASHVSKS